MYNLYSVKYYKILQKSTIDHLYTSQNLYRVKGTCIQVFSYLHLDILEDCQISWCTVESFDANIKCTLLQTR